MRISVTLRHAPCRLLLAMVLGGVVLGSVAGCSSWQRDPDGMPDISSIQLKQRGKHWVAYPPSCYALAQPERDWDNVNRAQVAFGCATYTNLAQSLVRPRDLDLPRRYKGTAAEAAALSVTRYRENRVEPLRESTTLKIDK